MPSRPRRTFRFTGYALVALCGLAAILWPPASVSQAATSPLVFVWITFLIVGGVVCACGAGWDVWLGEYIGLWFLVTAFAVFGFSALASLHWYAIAGGTCLLAVACWLVARWQEVAVLRREATRQQRAGR